MKMHVKRCNGNYKTSRKNEYGYDTLCIVGIKKMGPRGGVWDGFGGILAPKGVFGARKTSFFVIFFLKRTIDVPNKDPLNRPRVRVPPS